MLVVVVVVVAPEERLERVGLAVEGLEQLEVPLETEPLILVVVVVVEIMVRQATAALA
jgi:nitrate reductase NapAB chaperone NapD